MSPLRRGQLKRELYKDLRDVNDQIESVESDIRRFGKTEDSISELHYLKSFRDTIKKYIEICITRNKF